MLSSVTALQPAEWRFVTGPAGKPEVDPALGAQLRFSLSHTSGLVAASVSLDDHVGVDVEVLDPGNLPLDVAAFPVPG